MALPRLAARARLRIPAAAALRRGMSPEEPSRLVASQLTFNDQSTCAPNVCSKQGCFARAFSSMMSPLHFHYEDVLREDLLLKLNPKNYFQVPRMSEVKLIPKASSDSRIQFGKLAMEILCGQKFIQAQKDPYSKARKSSRSNPLFGANNDAGNDSGISQQSILRGPEMYHFLARILTVMSMLDSRVEMRENSIKFFMDTEFCEFSPELEDHLEIFEQFRGFNLTIITSANTKDETLLLWSGFLQKDEGETKTQL